MKKVYSILAILLFVQIAFAQNFSGGYNFVLPYDDGTVGNFLPKFPASPITTADKVTAVGADFDVSGSSYKFWGVNLSAGANFPNAADAVKIAQRMRKMGINLVRMHHLDNPWTGSAGSIFVTGQSTRTLNPTTLDKLDRFIYELKQQGIYVDMNLNVSRPFNALDGVQGAASFKEFAKGITIFDKQLVDLQKEYAQQLLTHINPYTGIALAADPVLAMVEMINENSLYGMWKDNQLVDMANGVGYLIPRHVVTLDSLWNVFLTNKYGTQANLAAAWYVAPITNPELIVDGGFENATLATNWQSELHAGAAATFTQDNTQMHLGNKSAKIQIANAGTEDWHIQFKHVNFSIAKNIEYKIQFYAKAAANKNVAVSITRNGPPYNWYGGSNMALTNVWKLFTFYINISDDLVNEARLTFGSGTNPSTFWIDDVSMKIPTKQDLIAGENLALNNIARINYSEKGSYSEKRIADLADFYITTQKSFMENMRNYLKTDLLVDAPITGTNALTGIQESYQHENMDYLDDHSYWDHPNFDPNDLWSETNWYIYNNPMVKNLRAESIIGAFSGVNKNNKPYTISEYNHVAPNRFRTEMPAAIAAYSSFHGADGIMFYDYNGENIWTPDFVGGYFSIHRDHSVMSLFPSCAYAYRKKYIAAGATVNVNYSAADISKSFLQDNNGRWGKYVPYNLALNLTNAIKVNSYNAATNFDVSTLPAASSNIYETSTLQTKLDVSAGILTTKTPKFISISGFLNELPNTQVQDLTLVNANQFGAITWISIDDKTLVNADTSLLTISTKQQNTNMTWNAANNSVTNLWGQAPTLQAPMAATLRLNINADAIRLHKLNTQGNSSSFTLINPIAPGVFEITINQATDQTMWYGIEKINTLLPIESVIFSAEKNADAAYITWADNDNLQTKKYTVEYSKNGRDFKEVVQIENTTNATNYNHTQQNASSVNNKMYYRLKVEKLDGKIKYTEIRIVNFTKSKLAILYPNPVRDVLQIENPNATVQIKIIDASGKIVLQKNIPNGISTISVEKLVSGIYYVQLLKGKEILQTEKLEKLN